MTFTGITSQLYSPFAPKRCEFQPAAKSSKANAPAKPAGLAAAARGRGRAAASRAKDSIAAEAIDEDEPEETGAAPTEKAADNKVRIEVHHPRVLQDFMLPYRLNTNKIYRVSHLIVHLVGVAYIFKLHLLA